MRYLSGLLGFALCAALAASPLSAQTKRAPTGYTADVKAGKTTITVYYDDGLVLVMQPATLGAKGADVTDVLSVLGLLGAKLPSISGPTNAPAGTTIMPPPIQKQSKADAPAGLDVAKGAIAAIVNGEQKSAGTAVLIGQDRLITTASLGAAKKLKLRFAGGAELPADVIGSDHGVSILSVIQAPTGKRQPIPFGTSREFTAGYVIGSPYSPDEQVLSVAPTAVNQTITVGGTLLSGAPSFKGMMRLSRDLQVPAAGSAVVDADGKLVALVCSWTSLEGTWAMPIEQVAAGLPKD